MGIEIPTEYLDTCFSLAFEICENCNIFSEVQQFELERYGGSGLSFTSSAIAIEELAKIDPAVSVMVDVQVL